MLEDGRLPIDDTPKAEVEGVAAAVGSFAQLIPVLAAVWSS